MSQRGRSLCCLLSLLAAIGAPSDGSAGEADLVTPRHPATDIYHGNSVVEEYRWLEDWSQPAVRTWSERQNAETRAVLDAIPARAEIARRLEQLTRPVSPEYYALRHCRGVYFAMKAEPPNPQPVLIRFAAPEQIASAQVLLDPAVFDSTGSTTIDFFEPSLDGKKVAVSLSRNGSESGDVIILDAESGQRLPDLVPGVNGGTAGGSIAWNADGSAFLRTRYPAPGERPAEDLAFYEQVHEHRLGTDGATDPHVFGRDLPRIAEIFLESSLDGRYVLADVLNGDGGEHAFWLRGPGGEFRRIADFSDGFIQGGLGAEDLFLLERRTAHNGRIVRLPLEPSAGAKLTAVVPEEVVPDEVVPESATAIEGFTLTASRIFVTDVLGGPNQVRIFDQRGGTLEQMPLPGLTSVGAVVRTDGDVVLIQTEGYTTPSAWWRYDPATGRLETIPLGQKSNADLSSIEVRREFAVSKDGTRVPMTILIPPGLEPGPETPALLTGYGGFAVSLSPGFDERRLVWLEQGGIYVIANLRGGGEYGEAWHQAGCLTHKQNVFDDFTACAQHLIEAGYTSPAHLAIEGGSNGGLLMGATLTQHPELYRVVIAEVGIYDVLRNELTPNGTFNTTEYGSVRDPEQFRAMFDYSPYHHVVDGTAYPSVLLLTGEHDPRVDPFHSRKMAARLQAATASGHPIRLRTSATTGHGIGTPYDETVEEQADVLAFLFAQLGREYRPIGARN